MDDNKYRTLVESDVVLGVIVKILFETASLSYNREYLCFDGDALRPILKVTYLNAYKDKYNELIKEYNERNKSDGNNDN